MSRQHLIPGRSKPDILRHFLLPAGIVVGMITGTTAAENPPNLFGSCFARSYDARYLAAHPGQRVAAISANFQGFEDNLLTSVIYKLRYGTTFGFSGPCYVKIEGGFLCEACVNDNCETSGGQFEVRWSGGDSVKLVNNTTGMLSKNAEGGRDYLPAGGENGEFVPRRAAPEDCTW